MPRTATYSLINSQTLGSNQTTVTFSSIPATYTDLILVFTISQVTNGGNDIFMTFNSDTSSNYSRTYLLGDGSTATSGRNSTQTSYAPGGIYLDAQNIINILDYANTTTYKTPIARISIAAQYAAATVGLWRNTAAINRIDLTTAFTSNIKAGSTFKLYGIQAGNA